MTFEEIEEAWKQSQSVYNGEFKKMEHIDDSHKKWQRRQ